MSARRNWSWTKRSGFESSPTQNKKTTKRPALGDISNRTQDDQGRQSTAGKMDLSDDCVEDMEPVFDIDISDRNDPQACTEYVNDIFRFLHVSQRKYKPADYLKMQTDITPNMTGILMDWLVEVAEEYHLNNETLHLAKHYIDRFLSTVKVTRSRLQLVGVCAMLVASKFEEIFPPGVEDFVYISDNTFSRAQVIEMESLILNSLNFDLCNPTALEFLNRYVRISNAESICATLAKYLAELTLIDYNMAVHLPSHIALSCLVLANHARGNQPALHSSLHGFVELDEHESIKNCILSVYKLWVGAPRSKLQAVRLKYERTRNQKVATIVPPNTPPVL